MAGRTAGRQEELGILVVVGFRNTNFNYRNHLVGQLLFDIYHITMCTLDSRIPLMQCPARVDIGSSRSEK